jgi:hypothetical protein
MILFASTKKFESSNLGHRGIYRFSKHTAAQSGRFKQGIKRRRGGGRVSGLARFGPAPPRLRGRRRFKRPWRAPPAYWQCMRPGSMQTLNGDPTGVNRGACDDDGGVAVFFCDGEKRAHRGSPAYRRSWLEGPPGCAASTRRTRTTPPLPWPYAPSDGNDGGRASRRCCAGRPEASDSPSTDVG